MATAVQSLENARTGILFDRTAPECRGSISSAEGASKALAESGLAVELIDLARTGPGELPGRIDLALLAVHGLGGEDGKIQGALDALRIPYSGSGVLASALGMHKPTFKMLAAQAGIDTPRWAVLRPERSVAATLASAGLEYPVFVKPASGGASLAAGIAHDKARLRELLAGARAFPYTEFMVEEYIRDGRDCTVGLIEVDGRLRTLPVLDVVTRREFYDNRAKRDASLCTENCPSLLPTHITEAVRHDAQRVFRLIGAHGVLRVDFLVTADGRTTLLEANTLPGLSPRGNLAAMARADGITYPALIRHVARTALTKPGYLP
ncbi:D-alanine--D-alanine ligase [Streptomyces luteireticuli]|uniref:D-alanine--D-alanine ligase family protein n=1 Tax=Streptomyces luteireticuli TaxID=173858 RepID=UPI0035573248